MPFNADHARIHALEAFPLVSMLCFADSTVFVLAFFDLIAFAWYSFAH